MNSFQEEKKVAQLKYNNIQWITLQTKSYKNRKSRISHKTSQSHPNCLLENENNNTFKLFKHSNVNFSKSEMDIIRKSGFAKQNSRKQSLTSSRFQQVQDGTSKGPSPNLSKSVTHNHFFTRVDSAVSISPFEEDDYINDTDTVQAKFEEGTGNSRSMSLTHDVTKEDIVQHVWIHCHENSKTIKKALVNFDGDFVQTSDGLKAVYKPSSGEKRLKRMIGIYSDLLTSKNALAFENVMTKDQKEQLAKARESIRDSLCAYRYREWIRNHDELLPIPEYIEFANPKKLTRRSLSMNRSSSFQNTI